jgi:hypothetical protein
MNKMELGIEISNEIYNKSLFDGWRIAVVFLYINSSSFLFIVQGIYVCENKHGIYLTNIFILFSL